MEDNKIKKLSYEERIKEYINLLNNGYIPKSIDRETTFSDGTFIESFWRYAKERIKEELKKEEYLVGYDLARKIVDNQKTINKISEQINIKVEEYIEMINNGYIPKRRDYNTNFLDGTKVGQFLFNHKSKIIDKLVNDPKYAVGYDTVKKALKIIDESIEKQKEKEEKINKLRLNYIKNAIKLFNINTCEYDEDTIYLIYKLHNIFKTKTFIELLDILNTYKMDKKSWIYVMYGNNIEDILIYLNLDSKRIIYDMKNNIITLKNAIKREISRELKLRSNEQLINCYYNILKEIDKNCDIIDKITDIINSYELTKEETKLLEKAIVRYIEVIKKYHMVNIALTSNVDEKIEKSKKHHLTTEETISTFYITFEFYKSKVIDKTGYFYYRNQMLKDYLMKWDKYSLEEKKQIIDENGFMDDEIENLDNLSKDVKIMLKKIL